MSIFRYRTTFDKEKNALLFAQQIVEEKLSVETHVAPTTNIYDAKTKLIGTAVDKDVDYQVYGYATDQTIGEIGVYLEKMKDTKDPEFAYWECNVSKGFMAKIVKFIGDY